LTFRDEQHVPGASASNNVGTPGVLILTPYGKVTDMINTQDTPAELALAMSTQIINSYGYVQCTCGKYPKITYMNTQMMTYLGLNAQDFDNPELLRENLLFMIPSEEHELLQNYMDQARLSTKPIHIRHHFFCKDGTRLALNGWICSETNEWNETKYSFVYIDDADSRQSEHDMICNTYFEALKQAYNMIFEINIAEQTVKCIHGRDTSAIGTLYDVNMTLESAKNFWLNNYIVDKDRTYMADFFEQITSPPQLENGSFPDDKIIQTDFRCNWIDNVVHNLSSVAFYLDFSTVLLCLRDVSNITYSRLPDTQDIALDKLHRWIDCMVTHDKVDFGIVILEKTDVFFSITYISEKILYGLGLDHDEYMDYIFNEYSAQHLLDKISVSECSLEQILTTENLSLTVKCKTADGDFFTREVTLSVTQYQNNNSYFYKILVNNKASTPMQPVLSKDRIFARTFGHFDLFVDHIPVVFTNQKEKEFLALLIDLNGGTLNTADAINYLWEDEEINDRLSRRYRKLCTTLKNTLAKYGIEHILINTHGIRSINVAAITCDYYEYLAGNPTYKDSFHNTYMSDYSWAERTLANLWDYNLE
jgi:hypothetical protein